MIINIAERIGFGASLNRFITPALLLTTTSNFTTEKTTDTIAAEIKEINDVPHKNDLWDLTILLRIIDTINPIINEIIDIIIKLDIIELPPKINVGKPPFSRVRMINEIITVIM